MAYTSDSTFMGGKLRPFSRDFAEKLQGMARDISAINTLMPSLQHALQLIDPSGFGTPVFPADIIGGKHPNYQWVETIGPTSSTAKENGRSSFELGGAANTLEVGLDPDEFIPPGLHSGCLDVINNSGGGYTVEPVIASVVMMSSAFDQDENKVKFYFSCPVALCPNCGSGSNLELDPDAPIDPEFTRLTGKLAADASDGVIQYDQDPEMRMEHQRQSLRYRESLVRRMRREQDAHHEEDEGFEE